MKAKGMKEAQRQAGTSTISQSDSRGSEIIVVGVGAMGAAACYQLAARGARVLGIEQFDIPHNLGSSHGLSRIIRQAYFEHPDYVPLLRRAYELWRELEKLSGRRLLHLTGALYAGPESCELIGGSLRAAKLHHLPCEMLSHRDAMSRFGQFAIPNDHVALWEPQAGFLEPEQCIAAYVQAARDAGAVIHAREAVRSWSANGQGVVVQTDRARYRADQIIFCAGAWSGKLLADLGVNLVVTRQAMAWFDVPDPRSFRSDRFPVWAFDRPAGGIYYGFPHDSAGVKAAVHFPGQAVDPDQVDRRSREEDVAEVRQFIQSRIQGVGALREQRICLYTNSPDGHFIIDRHPRHERVLLACGFSGHGFKFASVVGQILADLALDSHTHLPAQFLSLARFK